MPFSMYANVNAANRLIDKSDRIVQMQRAMATQQLGTLGVAPGPGQIGVQSLEDQLYILTYGDAEFKLYRDLETVPVFNLVHEYNVLNYYTSAVGAAVGMGALPPVNNSNFARGWALVKFYEDVRMIPQQMLEIESSVGNYAGVETRNSIMSLIGKVNHHLYWGDSTINQFAMDGVYAQVSRAFPNNVIDLRGSALTPDYLERAALLVRQNWGSVSQCKLYASPAVITPFTVNFLQNQRVIPSMWEGGTGNPFSYWDTQFGRIYIRDDRFAERDPFNGSAPITSLPVALPNMPPAPTAAPTVSAPAADSLSQFNAQTPGGYFAYCYAYKNSVGVSVASPISSVVNVQNGQSVTLTIPTVGVQPAPQSIYIYRQQLSSATATPSYSGMQLMAEVPATISVSGTTYVDRNLDLPGTYTAFLINTSKDGAHIGKLGDVQKFDLAPVSMAYWFVTAWYGMLIMPGPQWSVILKNVGGSQIGTPVNAGYAA